MKLEGTKEEWAAGIAGVMLGVAATLSFTGHQREGGRLAFMMMTAIYVWRRFAPRRARNRAGTPPPSTRA
jgi:hypothetical protein